MAVEKMMEATCMRRIVAILFLEVMDLYSLDKNARRVHRQMIHESRQK
jgi:hypothetical protein